MADVEHRAALARRVNHRVSVGEACCDGLLDQARHAAPEQRLGDGPMRDGWRGNDSKVEIAWKLGRRRDGGGISGRRMLLRAREIAVAAGHERNARR